MKDNVSSSILITGGAGFVGANLVRALLKKGAREIHLLKKPDSDLWRLEEIKEKLILHQERLSERDSLKRLLKKIKPAIIYHLAAHGAYSYQVDVDKIVRTNILGILNLLFASKEILYKCFVNTGTSSEYGVKLKAMNEENVCQPISFYAATKLSSTVLCQVFAKTYHKPIVTLRPFSVYGPYEEKSRFVPTAIRCLSEKKPIKITSKKTRHDFIYIDDLINAYLKVPRKISQLSGKILNIGTGKEYTNDELVRILFKTVGKKIKVEKGNFPRRAWDTPHWVADISKAKKLLNWKPRFSLEKGILKTFNWFIENKSLYQ